MDHTRSLPRFELAHGQSHSWVDIRARFAPAGGHRRIKARRSHLRYGPPVSAENPFELAPGVNAELRKDFAQVVLHGASADKEAGRDLRI